MDNSGNKKGRFILNNLLGSARLTYNQVAVMEARALQNHLLSSGLDKQEILSIKRLRKRERIKKKDETENMCLASRINELNVLKYGLLTEKQQLTHEIHEYASACYNVLKQ